MAKATDIKLREKPYTFVMPLTGFSSRWNGRPTHISDPKCHIGLRLVGADERLLASTKATEHVDKLLPHIFERLSHSRTQDPCWAATYEVAWIHYLLGDALCSPKDINAPWHGGQDGGVTLVEVEKPEPGASALASFVWTDEGIARLWSEYDALSIGCGVGWPEVDDEDARKLGARLANGTFFEGLDAAAKTGNVEAGHVAAQLRRLLGYCVHLRTHGRESPVVAA